VEIAVWSAADAGFAVAGTSQPRAVLDPGGDADLNFAPLLDATLAATALARVGDRLAGAVAARTGGGDGEKAAGMRDLAATVTRRTRFDFRAFSGAAAVAFGTGVEHV